MKIPTGFGLGPRLFNVTIVIRVSSRDKHKHKHKHTHTHIHIHTHTRTSLIHLSVATASVLRVLDRRGARSLHCTFVAAPRRHGVSTWTLERPLYARIPL
ncbi:uncharacterized protein LY79DRAFT_262264 [Colletotrichum navitas]|uniref:Uncharacterized protein n=1 Tax=Colletotrichum navitas TaxID=681940 RepID=A0AAD8PX31_9PEZI|nr:uncharacterized protein LY79DRAFT_262264 [Colletotrichum navitas]KAK1585644.1 hypothetical protein LY79DRAFT_262264 [Colletotrichum navitas]